MMDVNTIFGLAGMGFTLLLIALVVVIIVALIKVWQTKVKTSKEGGYQKQIAEAIQMQRELLRQQEMFVAEMAEVKARLTSIERILKEVE